MHVYGDYIPAVILDNPILVAWPLATGLLLLGIISITYTAHYDVLRYFRLALAPPCLVLFSISWFPTGLDSGGTAVLVYTGNVMAFLKAVDVLLVGFSDTPEDVPRWVALKWTMKDGKEVAEKEVLPLPTTSIGRFAYAMDSLLTVQGGSFYKDRAFDWAPEVITSYRSGGYSRAINTLVKTIITRTLLSDLFSTLLEARVWDANAPRPLSGSGLGLPAQLLYSGFVGLFIAWVTFVNIEAVILISILLGADPNSWAPLFRRPLSSETLSELWSYRWHWAFRRSSQRLLLPFTRAAHGRLPKPSTRILRIFLSFGISTVFHLGVPLAMERTREHWQFWEPTTVLFFMAQPFGLIVEHFIILPTTERLSPGQRSFVRRVYLWVWLLYTGRWFADQFLKQDVLIEVPRWFPIHTAYRYLFTRYHRNTSP